MITSNIETKYLQLATDAIYTGEEVADRTGTGAYSIFGPQIDHDFRDGFPLLTTKKVFWRGVVEELLWMLRGSVDVNELEDKNIKIWSEWKNEFGTIGKGYGWQWRGWEKVELIEPRTFKQTNSRIRKYNLSKNIIPNICSVATSGNTKVTDYPTEYNIWNEMIHRCYDNNRGHFKNYGGRGIHVSLRWLNFENFLKDLPTLENYSLWKAFPKEYELDKDYYCTNRYSRKTCLFLSKRENRLNTTKSKLVKVYFPDYDEIENPESTELIVDIPRFADLYSLDRSTVYSCVRGQSKQIKGFRFEEIKLKGTIARVKTYDQIRDLIASIKTNPDCRRLIVSAWNPADIDRMKLPPCHCFFQFKVYGKKLHLKLYQRSADAFLGVPFNIASYALLQCIIAKHTGLEPGRFIHTFGDFHVYKNHKDQMLLQISREVRKFPTLKISDKAVNDISEYTFDDFQLIGYDPHPAIKGEVSV